MANLVSRCKQIADLENDDSISPAEWKWFISMVYGELCSEVSLGVANRYFETSTTITANGSTSYDEPDDHYSTVRVVEVIDNRERPLREIQQHEEAAYRGHTGVPVGWILVDDQLYLCPAPSTGTYKWYYLQQPTDLATYADADIVDVVMPAGEMFVVYGVAVLALGKGGKNVQLAMAQRNDARAQLQFFAAQRNVTDVKTRGAPVDDDDPRFPGEWWP